MNRNYFKNWVKDALIAANTAAGANVFTNRVRELDPKALPAINIRTQRESAQRVNEAPIMYARTYSIGIVCICHADDDVDEALDALAAQVEEALITAAVMNDLPEANRIEYISTDLQLEIASEEIGAALVTFNIEYDSRHDPVFDDGSGSGGIGDFEGVDIEIREADAADEDEFIFKDKVDLPTT